MQFLVSTHRHPFRRFLGLMACVSLLAGRLNQLAADESLRVWVDQSGQHAIEGSVAEFDGNTALLIKPNGSKVKIRLSQLSEEDQTYLEQWSIQLQNHPNKLRQSVPQLPPIEPLPILKLAAATNRLADGEPLENASPSNRQVRAELPLATQPDPAPTKFDLVVGAQNIGSVHSYDRCSPVMAIKAAEQDYVAISISSGLSSIQGANANRIVTYASKTKQTRIVWSGDEPVSLIDHHAPSGKTLVLVGHRLGGQGGRLALASGGQDELWTLSEHRSLPPNTPESSRVSYSATRLHWARWVDDEHIVAAINSNVAVWNLAAGEQKHWVCSLESNAVPAISAGRRYVAVPQPGSVLLFRTSDGECLGRFPVEQRQLASVSFSPRGDSLAIATSSRLRIWELSSASLRGEVESPRSLGRAAPVWIDTDLVLSSSGMLLSIDRGVAVWRYELEGATADQLSPYIGLLKRQSDAVLAICEIPHESAKQKLKNQSQRFIATRADGWFDLGQSAWEDGQWVDRPNR